MPEQILRIKDDLGTTHDLAVEVVSGSYGMRSRSYDVYTDGEVLADQSGEGVRTFTFASPVDQVWIRLDGGDGRADPFGGTPSSSVGIICEDGIPMPVPVRATTVEVYVPNGASANVWGFRYE